MGRLSRCEAHLGNRSRCTKLATGYFVVDGAVVEALCGIHKNQREHAGARVMLVLHSTGVRVRKAMAW